MIYYPQLFHSPAAEYHAIEFMCAILWATDNEQTFLPETPHVNTGNNQGVGRKGMSYTR
jgi:hypothetical protein